MEKSAILRFTYMWAINGTFLPRANKHFTYKKGAFPIIFCSLDFLEKSVLNVLKLVRFCKKYPGGAVV